MRIVTVNKLKDAVNKKFGEEHSIYKYISDTGIKNIAFKNSRGTVRLVVSSPHLRDFNTENPFIPVRELLSEYHFLEDNGNISSISRDDLFGFVYII